ncbi:unnamed protein product [Durusdinium trenchii]|uniref:Uncharacterized protein n=1 Tax=Durusdinium trenchii TaxID=1381693 RepID=A0ABP0I3K4_9DINO
MLELFNNVMMHCSQRGRPDLQGDAFRILRVSLKTCTQDEENEDDEPPSHSRKQPTEAWEARPYSSQSTASTFASTGKHQDAASGYSVRPTSSTSQMSGFTPSTTPGSKRSTASRRSRLSRSGSLPSSAGSPEALREAALCASGIPRPSSREIALNDVKLEDARQRATKSLEVLQAKLRASRADSVPSEETKSTKTKSVRLQDPAFAAPGPARGGQAWARYKGCLIKSGVTKDAMRTANTSCKQPRASFLSFWQERR